MMKRNAYTWEIIPAAREHIPHIAAHMREEDRREVWASNRRMPVEALEESLAASEIAPGLAWTCMVDGYPIFMFGVARAGSILSDKGAPWLLGTDVIARVHIEFARRCRDYVDIMRDVFPRLENFVHAENKASLRWLRWCGFTVEKDAPVMMGEEPFYRFWR